MNKLIETEFIKFKKNYSFFTYIVFFIIGFIVFGFTYHITRVGNGGNQIIPLNITYSGLIYKIGFFISFGLIMIIIDSDIRDEIKTGKVQFLLTQSIDRKQYLIGKVFFYLLITVIWFFILLLISWFLAKIPFAGRNPLLLDNTYLSFNKVFFNFFVQYLFLIPLMFLFILFSINFGFHFKMQSISIIIIILMTMLFMFKVGDIFTPFIKMRIYNNQINHFKFFSFSLFKYLVITCIFDLIFMLISLRLINKREM